MKFFSQFSHMKSNKLVIRINRPVHDVFLFTITPPNSARWIPNIIKEETNEWPVRVGTVYTLQTKSGAVSKVAIDDVRDDERVEWVSPDRNYHCRYMFQNAGKNMTELRYHEWVNEGQLEEPFNERTLGTLKSVLENRSA